MPENPSDQPVSPAPNPPEQNDPNTQVVPVNTEPPGAFSIGEEFGTREKNLPPGKIVAICLGILALIIVIFAVIQRPTASASGSIDNVTAVAVPNQNSLLVAITVSFRNHGKKPFWIENMKASLVTDSGNYTDTAAPALDFDRYFQAFPELKQHAQQALKPEDKIAPGDGGAGTIIVSFPVTMDAFNSRKSLTVTIQPYDQAVPLVMTK